MDNGEIFWDIQCDNHNLWKHVFLGAKHIIYVIDVACYDEYDNIHNMNKMRYSLKLCKQYIRKSSAKHISFAFQNLEQFWIKFLDKRIHLKKCPKIYKL